MDKKTNEELLSHLAAKKAKIYHVVQRLCNNSINLYKVNTLIGKMKQVSAG